jgi:hypothetical protein
VRAKKLTRDVKKRAISVTAGFVRVVTVTSRLFAA